METKKKILIVDDSEMNRVILSDILENRFEILEAENGEIAIKLLQKKNIEISLVLLDIVMPVMDGFEVLKMMNQYGWIEDIPVVMISSENSSDYVEKAYELGVSDFISRPFDSAIVYRRVLNTIMLYAKQKKLEGMIADQIIENEKRSNLMVAILSHIVEFRNGESGLHVLHVQTLTELLLNRLMKKTDRYPLNDEQISLITTTSALHDIGKIAIPEEVLNKPGKLTDEEFEIMKTHCSVGADMLKGIPFEQDELFMKIAIEICQSHHERYDGKGYPHHLKKDEIPISAQVVALADVYDALTSERVYKKAYSPERALDMILNGECGVFNPLLLECLRESHEEIQEALKKNIVSLKVESKARLIANSTRLQEGLTTSERALKLLEYERKKNEFYASMSQEIQFEYTRMPSMLTFSDRGAKELGIQESILDPLHDESLKKCFQQKNIDLFMDALKRTTPEHSSVQFEFEMVQKEERRWKRVVVQTIWIEESNQFYKFYGKIMDVHEEHSELMNLKRISLRDGLTGLYNRVAANRMINERMQQNPTHHFAFIIFDVDDFKSANDQYGHIFGDSVLKHIADRLSSSIRQDDIAARIGGDEFLLFLEYKSNLEMIVERIFKALNGQYKQFKVSISMGISKSDEIGTDLQKLFYCADSALYYSKKNGKGSYSFYDKSMQDTLTSISTIDGDN